MRSHHVSTTTVPCPACGKPTLTARVTNDTRPAAPLAATATTDDARARPERRDGAAIRHDGGREGEGEGERADNGSD